MPIFFIRLPTMNTCIVTPGIMTDVTGACLCYSSDWGDFFCVRVFVTLPEVIPSVCTTQVKFLSIFTMRSSHRFSETLDFIDSLTKTVQVVLVFFSPRTGLVTMMNVKADMRGTA